MYRITKPSGAGANITVENMDTRACVMIGKFNNSIAEILEKAGIKIGEGGTDLGSIWSINIDYETASQLCSLALKMKKPIRDQRKKKEPEKKIGVDVDAFDLIFGI